MKADNHHIGRKFCTVVIQTVRYSRAKKSIKNYYAQLGRLTKIYAREEKRGMDRNVFRRDEI